MNSPYRATSDTWVIGSFEGAPGLGFLPVNAFLIEAAQPVLIDTGISKTSSAFMESLRSIIDPRDISWIVITHEDADHSGAIQQLVSDSPKARFVLNWVAMSRLQGNGQLPDMSRVYLMNPGQSLEIGDRKLHAVRPPVFDSPSTLAFVDDKTHVLFSSDAFGSLLPHPAEDLEDVTQAEFEQGFSIFNRANHPWIHLADETKFGSAIRRLQQLDVATVLSSHAPAAHGRTDWLLDRLAALPSQPEFVGPDQAALTEMLARMSSPAA
jgi:flavorubredoxin